MRNPRAFFHPLAIDAPEPPHEIPFKPSRMIHFFDASNEKMRAKVPDMAKQADILLGNLEDAVPVDKKIPAREGLIEVAKEVDFGETQLWTRVNELASPWVLDDLTQLVTEIGDKLEVIMVPKVEGPWDIHYVDRLLAQLEAKAKLERPLLVHAILETSLGVVNLEEIATASPRMQGMSFGPADLAASRRMKTTRVGGGHPGYRVIEDPDPDNPEAARPTAQQDPWHYSIARMVDACTSAGILPFYGPYGDIKDTEGCETQFRAAFLLGCVGAWSLHPAQIEIAKKVFSPPADEVLFAKKVLEAIPDGAGVHMIDGKMQDDATWLQCKVMVDLAECDPQGVVFNANYLTYFDLTMTELWRELGGYQTMVDDGVDMVVAEARLRYLAPLRFDDEFEGRVRIARLGETSMSATIELVRGSEPVVEGELRYVFIETGGGVKQPIPESIRERLSAYA
jgi:malyl-CoA/(S)-citramalyl-CoA lyase